MNEKYIIWAGCVMALASLSISANLLQIVKIYFLRRQTSVFHMTVLSLGAADMIASAMFLMQGLRKFLTNNGMAADNVLLRFAFTGCYFSVFSSCVHIIFIAVQRLIIICCPLTWKEILKIRRVQITLFLIWLASAIFAALSAVPSPFKQKLSLLIFVSCAFITGGYGLIVYFSVQRQQANRNATVTESEESRKKTVQVHSFAIMVTFLLCTFPYAVARFYSHSSFIYIVCDIMFAMNPLLDPLLYFFLSRLRSVGAQPALQVSAMNESNV